MKKLLSLVLCVSGSIAAFAPTVTFAGDRYSVADLFPKPEDQVGIRKVAAIETSSEIGFVIIQWNPDLASDSEIKRRVSKLCARQSKHTGQIEVIEGFNDSTDTDASGRTVPTRSGMIECMRI